MLCFAFILLPLVSLVPIGSCPSSFAIWECEDLAANETLACLSSLPGWYQCSAVFNLSINTFELRRKSKHWSQQIKNQRHEKECVQSFLNEAQGYVWGNYYKHLNHLFDQIDEKNCQRTTECFNDVFDTNSTLCDKLNISGQEYEVKMNGSSIDFEKFLDLIK